MGAILKRWRREESAEKELESLQEQLHKLESARQKDEQFYQRFIGRLMFYSIMLYIVSAVVMYFYYFPKQWKDRITRILPLLIFPLIIYGVRRTLMYVFSTRKKKNAQKLEELRSKKQKIIEDVKEKETYKKAKEILEKFDPENSLVKNDAKQDTNNGKMPCVTPGTEVRQRNVPRAMSTPNSSFSQKPVPFSATPKVQMMSPLRGMSPAMQRQFFINNMPPGTPPGPPQPIPVLPKERTMADKFVDYLVGDGPSNRYALICKACHSHNGMALKEGFEYTTFRCCYCYQLNEAKKQRPSAPPLEGFSTPERKFSTDDTTINEEPYHETENVEETIEDNSDKTLPESCSEGKEAENIQAVQENL
ncbi:endoplasmic reticulum junction formation protein lunapark-B-like [Dendronephthya gigantea]|uniref:endoplasmic reticulum junction formation protein lunapark-B-like n=1 Tax=Dendronephthya gigantea TaxID=151771 RepID=UPI00106A078D|nr:endoplasmic reticulum junction formation protein lunapark-B-like [Dendronephthya gigantea]